MMFDFLKNLFTKRSSPEENKTEKEKATALKQSYIAVVDTKFDPKNPTKGYFELDWNSYFIEELKNAGYTGISEEEIVDKWFNNICQNVVDEAKANREVRVT